MHIHCDRRTRMLLGFGTDLVNWLRLQVDSLSAQRQDYKVDGLNSRTHLNLDSMLCSLVIIVCEVRFATYCTCTYMQCIHVHT